MELMPGYKDTDIGVIPEDWEVVNASEIGAFRGGNGFPTKYQGAKSGSYPFFKVSDMNNVGNEKNMVNSNNWISEDTRRTLGSYLFPQNSIVFAKVGAAIFLERKKILSNPSCIDNNMAAFIIDKSRADHNFIHAVLLSMRLGDLISATALPALNSHQLGRMLLPLPPLREQSAIAEALADVDAAIEATTSLVAKKRDLRTAAMQRLLVGEQRLEARATPWRVKKLGDHVTFLRNGTHSRAQLTTEDPVRYLHYGDIHVSSDAYLDLRLVDLPRLHGEEARRLSRLADGDLVFVDASEDLSGIGKSVEICGLGEIELVAGQHTIAARFDKTVLADGFKAYLQHIPDFTRHLRRLAAGTKVYATNRRHIASAEILLPEPEEQQAIAAVLGDMSAEIAALEQRLAKTTALKQAMMQALLTGRVRLPTANIEQADKEPAHA